MVDFVGAEPAAVPHAGAEAPGSGRSSTRLRPSTDTRPASAHCRSTPFLGSITWIRRGNWLDSGIADLAGSENLTSDDVSEAIQYRSLDRQIWG